MALSPSIFTDWVLSPSHSGTRGRHWLPVRLGSPFWLVGPVASILAGCARPDIPRAEQSPKGCVFMLPGIEGTVWQLAGTRVGLRQAGIDRHIEAIAWGKHPLRQLHNLCAIKTNREVAGRIAAQIVAYRAAHPDAPITLIGYSGGGGIAVLTAEALPEEVKLDRVILIAAAVSPCYDLSRVFARARHGVINFYSDGDWLILGWGTRVFGTIDRRRTASAGRIGFRDGDGGVIQSKQLTQVSWRRDWRSLGHSGGHIGWLSSDWAREVLARYVDSSLAAGATTEVAARQ